MRRVDAGLSQTSNRAPAIVTVKSLRQFFRDGYFGAENLSNCLAIARNNAGAVAGTVPASGGEAHMDQLLYTIAQCCRMVAIGRTKFYERVASGEIPVRKIGKKTLVAAADLQRWAEQLPTIKTKGGDAESA